MAALLAPCPFRGVKAFCNVKKSPIQCPRRGFVAIHAASPTSDVTIGRRSIMSMAALLAAASALSTPAAHAVGLKAAKGKQAAGKGGLFNPAGRTEELAGAESKRKKELKEKYARLRAGEEKPEF